MCVYLAARSTVIGIETIETIENILSYVNEYPYQTRLTVLPYEECIRTKARKNYCIIFHPNTPKKTSIERGASESSHVNKSES